MAPRSHLVISFLALTWAGATCATPSSGAEPVTLYRNLTLIDGTGGPARPGMAILTRGERIVAVGPVAELPSPSGATVV